MPKRNRMKSAQSDHANLDDVKSDIATLRADVSDLIHGLAESGIEIARTGADNATDAVSRAAESAREHAHDAHEQLRESVSERPITSLAVAFGVGALIGRFMARH